LIGIVLFGLGAAILALGDTWYYAVVGLLLLLSGVFVFRGKREGIWLFAAVLALTLGWAISEVGLDGWSLIPRLVAPAVLGLWVFSPLVVRACAIRSRLVSGIGMGACVGLVVFTFAAGYVTTHNRFQTFADVSRWNATPPAPDADDNRWQFYGRTPAGDRYSPQAQITPANVASLQPAWSFSTGDMPRPGENARGREFSFEATPIKVGNSLYLCTPHRDVVALDATTGKQIWRYSPAGDMSKNIYQACRGVSYYDAPQGTPCPHRIISTGSGDPTLFALDAETGKLCEGFGNHGKVDLREGMGPLPLGFHFITSPPLVLHDRIMLSGWVYDDQTVDEPSGVIRAFDPVTGALAWAWDMGRTPATKPLEPGETFTRGTPNGWGVYTADPALNLVYVPLGIATPDYFGGKRRPFDEKYDTSLVALDITTGEERWHFQTVHHDLWDFDLPTGPSLVDVPGPDGTTIPALIQTTKQGQLFLLDRRDGKPVAKVEEKPVPQGNTPGEHYAPTQPFSTGMPNLTPPKFKATQTWGATPIDQAMCRLQYDGMRDDGLFTPPGKGTVMGYPAFDGVMDWYGGTIDPARKVMYVNYMHMPFTFTQYPYQRALKEGLFKAWHGWNQPYPQPLFNNNPQHGLPFSEVVTPWLGPLQVPCIAPPWGMMEAIDLVKRTVSWRRPVGTTANMGPYGVRIPVGLPTGMFMMGGNMTTASGLVFMSATADQEFRAFDGRTGKVLWQTTLPAGGNATPMTYVGADGRQYVVIAAGGHGGLKSRNGDQVMAFALPKH